jgi:hypothetical protein
MTHLYQLTDDFNELQQLLDSEDVNQQAVMDTLEGIDLGIKEKVKNIVGLYKNTGEMIPAIDEEIQRLTALKKAKESRQTWLKDYLLLNMQKLESFKLECDITTVTRVKGRDIVSVDSVDDLPADYVTVKTTKSADKRTLLADLKAGKKVNGAEITKSKESIRIK